MKHCETIVLQSIYSAYTQLHVKVYVLISLFVLPETYISVSGSTNKLIKKSFHLDLCLIFCKKVNCTYRHT